MPSDYRVEPDAAIGAAPAADCSRGRQRPEEVPQVGADRPWPASTATLSDAVATAVALLSDLSDPHDAVGDGRLAIWLANAMRTTEARGPQLTADRSGRALPAVRAARAHLAAGELEDTYLALLTARDLLGSG